MAIISIADKFEKGMPEKRYKKLMAISDFTSLSTDKAIEAIGILVDLSTDLRRTKGLEYAKKQLEHILAGELNTAQKSLVYYFLGNTWASLRLFTRKNLEAAWAWEQLEVEKEITYLRLATRGVDSNSLPQIYTNLGNALSNIGRFIEAIDYWEIALEKKPDFDMALAARGHGLVYYAGTLYDNGHVGVLLKFAYNLLTEGLKGNPHPNARKTFEKSKKYIESRLQLTFLNEPLELENFSLGRSKGEKLYRKWCLKKRLFLNPLNDIGSYNIAAQDVLTCPSVVVGINEGPYYHGFYNQLKQEYVSARFLLYEGLSNNMPHYSDRRVLLYNTLDYPSYALGIEKQKLAFRAAYSLLDKIAFFLNHYMRLGIPEKKTSFKTFWYEDQNKNKGLRREFNGLENWPLRGLFWLSKDLYEDTPGFRNAIEPESQDLAEIRNHLEHKYLKIHEDLWVGLPDASDKTGFAFSDSIAHSVYRDEFSNKVLKMLRLARAALIYLSLGIHIEERRKHKDNRDKIVAPMPLDKWEDDWKR
jgi:tetratricopeptide (TPR) repeat protein